MVVNLMDKIDKTLDIIHDNKEIIKNAVEPASKEVGGILKTFTGFFNNVVLYPLKCLNMTFEQKAIKFEKKLQEKYNDIPVENRTDCPINILGPVLESLKYNIDEEYMQELFSNLLISSMDKAKQSNVHPKYAKIISEMNEVDARVFDFIIKNYDGYIKSGKVSIQIKGTNQYYIGALPDWLLDKEVPEIDIFDVSKSIIRLANWGLFDLMFDRRAGDSILDVLYSKKSVVEVLHLYMSSGYNVELHGVDCIISINDEGKNFAEVIMPKDKRQN